MPGTATDFMWCNVSNLGDFLYLLGIRVIFGISLAGCHRSVKSIICFILSSYYFTDRKQRPTKCEMAHHMSHWWCGPRTATPDSSCLLISIVSQNPLGSRGPLPCHPLYQCQLTSCELTSYGPGWTTEMGSSSWHLNPQDCFNNDCVALRGWLCGPRKPALTVLPG